MVVDVEILTVASNVVMRESAAGQLMHCGSHVVLASYCLGVTR